MLEEAKSLEATKLRHFFEDSAQISELFKTICLYCSRGNLANETVEKPRLQLSFLPLSSFFRICALLSLLFFNFRSGLSGKDEAMAKTELSPSLWP